MPSQYCYLFDSSLSVSLFIQNSVVVERRISPFSLYLEQQSSTVYRLRVRILLKDTDKDASVERWRNLYSFITTCDSSTHICVLHPQCITYKKEYVAREGPAYKKEYVEGSTYKKEYLEGGTTSTLFTTQNILYFRFCYLFLSYSK